MPQSFKLSRRIARLRTFLAIGLMTAIGACDSNNSLEPTSSTAPEAALPATETGVQDATLDGASLASSYAGGIPFGMFRQPTNQFGSRFNGAMRNIAPHALVSELAAIKARGGKVVLMMVGPEWNYKDADGHFSLTKWKARMDRFKGVNFSSYVNDGTVIGHYLIDEPQDAFNWNGRPVPPQVLEEMAQYSKQRWPNMPTIVRTWPDYLDSWSGTYRYLDAAWAQYAAKRFPNINAFMDENVTKAKRKGLALIVGLNVIDGSPTKGRMSASQVQTYGSALLNSSYPCAFISWQYRDEYLTSSVKDAMDHLRNKAENRGFKSCRGG